MSCAQLYLITYYKYTSRMIKICLKSHFVDLVVASSSYGNRSDSEDFHVLQLVPNLVSPLWPTEASSTFGHAVDLHLVDAVARGNCPGNLSPP